jgi:hypothetical protein
MKTRFVSGTGLVLAMVFAAVGALFLFSPEWVLRGMNGFARTLGICESPLHGPGYFPVMAASYMAVVTILAWRMFRDPQDPANPLLLSQAKAASALFSLGVFFVHKPYFILLANGILDGGIALAAHAIYRDARSRRAQGRIT